MEIVEFRLIRCSSRLEGISKMRWLGVFLSIMVALCGLIQLYLMNISSTSLSPWSWNALAIVAVLLGVLRYKMFDYSKEDKTKLTYFIALILLMNLILFGVWSCFSISDMESVLASGFVFTVLNFEESTWFFLCNLREETEVDTATS